MCNNIKIFITYHKESSLIQNNVLTPIHAGRAINSSEWLEENMIGDNVCDNISVKNNRYCELTVQYYVWKNLEQFKNPEYVGFCHYRRFFSFTAMHNTAFINKSGQIEYPYISDNVYELFGLSEENIRNVVKNYDIVTVQPVDLRKFNYKNTYEQYKNSKFHCIKDYDRVIDVLLRKYPEYKEAVNKYNNSAYGYFTNSFIMKNKLFNEYAEWLFSILFEAEKNIKEYKDIQSNRVIGYLGERLFGIYLTYKKMNSDLRILEVQQVYVLSTDKKNNIPIVFSTNDNYARPLYCAISSIKKNADTSDYFFIYILNSKKNLHYCAKNFLSKLNDKNCSIKFLTIDDNLFNDAPIPSNCTHITKEAYYRYILPNILNIYNKIIYLDCDLIVKSNLKCLYDTDIEHYYIAAVGDVLADESINRLGVNNYYNSGVLLLNLKKMRDDNISERLFLFTKKNSDTVLWPDQDAINVVMQDKIFPLDKKWNAQVGEYPPCYTSGFNKIGKEANIIHYIGNMKPWNKNCKSPFKDLYREYDKKLPILFKLSRFSIRNLPKLLKYINYKRKCLIKFSKSKKQFIVFDKYLIGKK